MRCACKALESTTPKATPLIILGKDWIFSSAQPLSALHAQIRPAPLRRSGGISQPRRKPDRSPILNSTPWVSLPTPLAGAQIPFVYLLSVRNAQLHIQLCMTLRRLGCIRFLSTLNANQQRWGRWGLWKCGCDGCFADGLCGHSLLLALLFDKTLKFPPEYSTKKLPGHKSTGRRPNAWCPEGEEDEEEVAEEDICTTC